MTGTWHFNELHPGDKTREPIQGEFFSTDAIQNPAEALVREGIQNSLDAKRNGELVRVRIYISGVEGSLPADKHNKYFEGSWEHFKAERNGLKDVPLPTENCPFLVYEDFGTTGLQGDIYQWHETTGVKNSFFYFFRAEGRSGKSELDRGRWGVGKYVFPRSSRVSSFLGVTARADDGKRLLMGQAVLKTHHVAEKHYSPDGYLGILSGNGLMLPIESSDFIKTSFQDFKLKRNTDPGLSIIVPWYDLDINDIMLAEAVIRGYFYSILAGELIVTIATPAKETILEKATLLATIETHYPQLGQELSSLIELTKWALSVRMSGVDVLNISPLEKAAEWRKDLIPDTLLLQMRQKLEAGDRIAVRVPVSVKEKGKEPKQSFFDVFLVRNGGDENERPFFIREGIIVSDIRSPRTRGIQSIVIADDKPLATFLGDSENPAHTQWQKDGSNFKGKYVHGPALLNFVIKSVTSIIQIMNEDRQEEDKTILTDIFSLPPQDEEDLSKTQIKESSQQEGKKNTVPKPPKPPKPSNKPKFKVQKIGGGFSVTKGDCEISLPMVLDIKVAYDVRKGNPINKYNEEDFNLNQVPVSIVPLGVEIKEVKANHMIIYVVQTDFSLMVSGFDEHRDLYVKVVEKEYDSD